MYLYTIIHVSDKVSYVIYVVADNLRDDYMENRHNVDEDEWPPNQPKTVVNVALIHYKGSRTEQELIEISKRHKEGTQAVDELAHHSRVTKDITKIFAANFINSIETEATTGKPPRFILIEGAPGIGKTVLAKKIAYLWAKKELLTDVNILFLLFLRDPALQNIKTPEQLIQYLSSKHLDDERLKNCVEEIEELKVGIVMDGFDEYPTKLRKRSFIADLIKGKVFHNCIVVLTSRPTATIYLHDKVDRRIEILGFAQEERDKYISESLDSIDQRRQLHDYLKFQPIINGLIYVPLHLAVLLYLFKARSKLPETLTEMNESFILHTIYRSLTKDELTPTGVVSNVDSLEDFPKPISDILNKLSKLALIGLQKNQLVFTDAEIKANCPEIENNIPGALNGFGLLQVVQHFSKKGAGTTASFNFLHFTMQEYLAALHVSTIAPYEQQLSLMKETFWSSTYNFMWMMYVGINGINSQTLVQFLYKTQPGADIMELTLSSNIKSNKLKCLHLFQCFMEAKSKEIPKEILSIFLNNEINFHGVQLLAYHISSLILYVSRYSVQLQSLNLRDCHIGDVGMSILEHFFTANPDKASSIQHIDLFGNNSVLLWNVYCAIFGQQNLIKLNWSSLGGVDVEEIVNVMNSNLTIQSLNLSNNHFKDKDAEKIANILCNNTMLQELDISNNDITTKGATAISKSVQSSITLKHLKLSWSNHFINTSHSTIIFSQKCIKDVDAQIVVNLICNSEKVTKLDLSHNKISDNSAESICKCIESNTSLKEIDISQNKLSKIGMGKITIALQVNKTIQKFNISHNNISDDGAIAISEGLKDNSTLQELNMSHNRVSDNGIINIGKTLLTNTVLQILDISYNIISDDGVTAFSDYLKKRNKLRELRISWNDDIFLVLDFMVQSCTMSIMNLGNTGAILISAFFYGSTNIQKLDVSHNKITDDGAIAISECLKDNNILREFNISYNEISNNGITYIGKALQINTTLQTLNISCNKISDDGAIDFGLYLKNNNTLQELNMSFNEITSEGVIMILKSIQSNSPLRTLNLIHNIVSKCGLMKIYKVFEKLRNVHLFQISYNNIVDDFQNIDTFLMHFDSNCDKEFNQFRASSRMKLDMHNRSASYKAKVLCFCAKDNNSVKLLNISNHDITNEGAKTIAKAIQVNTSLQQLDISHNKISDDGAIAISECLKDNNTLQELNISYNEVSNNGIRYIGKALQINRTLQTLNISYNKIFDDGAIAIIASLKDNNALQELNVSHNEVSNNGIINIGKTLQTNMTLQILDISYNKISDDGVTAFSDYLKKRNKLRELRISWNDDIYLVLDFMVQSCTMSKMNLGNTGAILISAFLYGNTYTYKLDISHNKISDDGAIAISECLKNNNTLRELNMSHNQVYDSGIINISKALKLNNTLQELNLSWNSITTQGTTKIAEAIAVNTGLHTLDLSSPFIDPVAVMILLHAMEHNHTMMRLVLSSVSVQKKEALLNKVSEVNKGRSKEGINRFMLDFRSRQCNILYSVHQVLSLIHRPIQRFDILCERFQRPIQRFQRPIQRFQRRSQMLTSMRNVPRIRVRDTRRRLKFHRKHVKLHS